MKSNKLYYKANKSRFRGKNLKLIKIDMEKNKFSIENY